MTKPYSLDLRERVTERVAAGDSVRAVATIFTVSVASVVRWSQRLRRTYVDQVLAPTLKPGDVVILDNLGSHKGKAVRRAIRASGARLLFLPPYSPDLNPIEQVFAKLKHLMRKAKERTVDATWKRTGSLLETFKSSECKNYLVNAGYASS